MSLIKTDPTAHWYTPEGKPCHTVLKANGKGERNTNITDARKLRLLPSVTGILKMWPSPGLESWKREQDILSAITEPRLPGESDQAFVDRIVEGAGAEAKSAASIGTVFHDAMSIRLTSGRWPDNPQYLKYFEEWDKWIAANLVVTELSESVLVNRRYGYAGAVDLVGQTYKWGEAILDFKNQNVKCGDPRFYDTWCFQLAAYNECLPIFERTLVSVVLDRNKPDCPHVKVWEKDEVGEAWTNFKCCLQLWERFHKYTAGEPI